MKGIFSGCKSLSSIPDISKWDTHNVIIMTALFNDCSNLTFLPDISNWDTQKVIYFNGIFCGCSSLKLLPDISKWDTHNIFIWITFLKLFFFIISSRFVKMEYSKC